MSPYFEGNVYLIRAIVVILIYVIALTHFLLSNQLLLDRATAFRASVRRLFLHARAKSPAAFFVRIEAADRVTHPHIVVKVTRASSSEVRRYLQPA